MRRWRAGLLAALASVQPASAAPAGFAIDPTHTFVHFEAAHFGTSTSRGRFERLQGTLQFDRAGRTGQVEIRVATASISTGIAALDGRLRDADVLDSAAFPEAVFASDRFVFGDDGKLAEVEGRLTLAGTTLPLTLAARHFNCYLSPMLLLREVCGGDFEATLAPGRWNTAYGAGLGLPESVRLRVQIEAIRE